MATSFPTSLQDLDATRGTTGQTLASPNHITHHTTEDDTLEALQAKVGIDNSAVTTSLDYKVKSTSSVDPGHKHTPTVSLAITGTPDGTKFLRDDNTWQIVSQADASTTVKGLTKISVAPASASNPIAVGDNDGRVPTQAENDAMAGTSGTAVSSSNKLVDNADTTGAGLILRSGKSYTAQVAIAQYDAVAIGTIKTHAVALVSASSQYLSAADSASTSPTGNFTVEAWIYPTALPALGNVIMIASKWGASGNYAFSMGIKQTAASVYRIYVETSSNGTVVASGQSNSYAFSTNTWYHVAMIYDTGGNVQFTVNGVDQGTATSMGSAIYNSTATFQIGAVNGTAQWDGYITDVRLWGTNKSVASILANYLHELSGYETNLNAYWKLDNALTDTTANGNTLTNNGSATFTTTIPTFTAGSLVQASGAGWWKTFIGFATAAISAGAAGTVAEVGETTMSALTQGAQYYLSDTAGAIATSAGTNSRKVGIATSSTTILITNIW